MDADPANPGKIKYNDIVRWVYNSLYRMNVECDFLSPESEGFENYALILVPALYAAPEPLLGRLNAYVAQGGHLFVTFKSAFADEYVKVSHHVQPAILGECLGVEYHQFAFPKEVRLKSDYYQGMDGPIHTFMELLVPKGAKVLASYCHQSWGGYAAVTRNQYGKGTATYLGCMMDGAMLSIILEDVLDGAGISRIDERFPVIVRKGKNSLGKEVAFYLNYSGIPQRAVWHGEEATDLLSSDRVGHGEEILIEPWGLRMIEA